MFVYPASAVNSGRKAALYGLGVAHLLVGRDRRLKRSPTDPDVLLLLPVRARGAAAD